MLKRLFSWRWWLGLKPKFATKPPKKYTICVIIPAYNEEDSIAETIQSIQNQSVSIDKIVVVDDCSQDNTGEIASDMGVIVIKTDKNQGTKATCQQYALEKGYIDTDLFVTIDADTTLDSKAIEKTLPYFSDSLTASVCGFVIPAKIETIWERGRFIEYMFGISLFKAGQNNMGVILVSSGCFSIFRTNLVEKMGGFKSTSIAEDMDLTWRLILNKYRIYCVQDSYCYPYDPPTFKIFVDQIDRWYRGFFQNFLIHRKNFHKNKKIGLFIYWCLIERIISPFILPIVIYLMIENIVVTLLIYFLIGLLIVSIFTIIKGFQVNMVWKVITSLPSYFIIIPVNTVIFWRSLWRELIKKEPLTVWNKGH
ncbi:MAG: glycosyltransferase [Candidatus Stahlbacteria bacterium]|nr:MAG: glycosyltransferase [Candidatus Stahlbacteria bacterium]